MSKIKKVNSTLFGPDGRGRWGRSWPHEIPDVLHPLLRLRFGASGHDQTQTASVDRKGKVMRPEIIIFFFITEQLSISYLD
jgi:hypothetical protein